MKPFVSLFARFGVNITERLKDARQAALWDERVQLITDDNYRDLIVNEELGEQEEKDRVWFLVISVTAAKQEGVSKILDDVFDSAYNETQIAGDLPHVRWGRIDYLNVTAITTKWGIWQAPYLVVLRNRGQELRFYKPHQLRIKAEVMREFLKVDGWDQTQPWSTAYSPGGDRVYHGLPSFWITKTYNTIVMIPRWLLFIISGTIASVAINFMHRGSPPPPKKNNPQSQPPQTTVPTTSVPSSPQTPKRSG
ncbi:hypothetical protein BD779DRAFT_1667782 [Infundibulicybe gibba]|nr:hypothetical protein BD779DRAFT_1667782 [Infundibulicybe gibba]